MRAGWASGMMSTALTCRCLQMLSMRRLLPSCSFLRAHVHPSPTLKASELHWPILTIAGSTGILW